MNLRPTERFSNRADNYRKYRPSYPAAVIDLMRSQGRLADGAAVADIGSGTGIWTKLLLDAGFSITAIEPNEAMRKAAEDELSSYSNFRSVDATAENTGLPDASCDAITVAQAFHWFDPQPTMKEFRRILKGGGWIFIIRNQRQIDTTPFLRAYEDLLRGIGEAYAAVVHRDQKASALSREILFQNSTVQVATYDNPQVLDWPALCGRFLSSSYVPAKGELQHEELLAQLEKIFQKHARNNEVVFDQVTEVYYGKG